MQCKSLSRLIIVGFLTLWLVGCDNPTAKVIKSPSDHREYRHFMLENGMQVMLVSDSKAEKSAATLDVHVGSFTDPKDRPGLAHFTEHMLFLGTEKYPQVGEYRAFIEKAGGYSNAMTTNEDTVYMFEVEPEHFALALDRFAQFFIAPTFDAEYVDRERHAVDSEYKLSFNQDGQRIYNVRKATSNPEHPFHRFSMGNLQTLADHDDRPVRDDLLAFYQTHYSADKMVLVVVAPTSLEELEVLVQERFALVPQRDTPEEQSQALILGPEQVGKTIYVQPNVLAQELHLRFPNTLPRDYVSKPASMVAHLLSLSNDGGLVNSLKAKDWITAMAVSSGVLAENQAVMNVTFSLTEQGKSHLDEITEAFFAYVAFLEEQGVQEWIFDELKAAGQRAFHFQEYASALTLAQTLAMDLQEHPATHVIRNAYLHADAPFAAEAIRETLQTLTPDNMRRFVIMPEVPTDKVEPYYQVAYAEKAFTVAQKAAWQAPDSAWTFRLPAPNPYLPEHFLVKPDLLKAKAPHLLYEGDYTLWHWQDSAYNVPKSSVMIGFWNEQVWGSPKQAVMTYLYSQNLIEKLRPFASQLSEAGASGGVSPSPRGLRLMVHGYSDKQPDIVAQLIDAMVHFSPNPEVFEATKDAFKRALLSNQNSPPSSLGLQALSVLLTEPEWSVDEMLAVIDDISRDEVIQHASSVIAHATIEGFLHGNMTSKEAQLQMAYYHHLLGPYLDPRTPREHPPEAIELAAMTRVLWYLESDSTDAAVLDFFQAGDASLDDQVKIALLAKLLETDFFTQLRTEEQLGYALGVTRKVNQTLPGLLLYLVSPNTEADAIYARIQQFVADARTMIEQMPEEAFEAYRESQLKDLKYTPKTLAEKSQRMWQEIELGTYRFDLLRQMVRLLEVLDKQALLEYFDTLVLNPHTRRELVLMTPAPAPEGLQKLEGMQDLKKPVD